MRKKLLSLLLILTLVLVSCNKAPTSPWDDFISSIKGHEESTMIVEVNDWVNQRITYHLDQEVYGVEDYWATPLEVIEHDWRGDCEDYVTFKLITYIRLGLDPKKFRYDYVVARYQVENKWVSNGHMVLLYDNNGKTLVLDSLVKRIDLVENRKDLSPIYSFNAYGKWLNNGREIYPTISKWDDLLSRLRNENWKI